MHVAPYDIMDSLLELIKLNVLEIGPISIELLDRTDHFVVLGQEALTSEELYDMGLHEIVLGIRVM
jgi:hypothetical protein